MHIIFPLVLLIVLVRYINTLFDDKEPIDKPIYISNKAELSKPFIPKYYTVLELDYKGPISIEIVNESYQRLSAITEDDMLRGYEPTHSIEELQAAKAYLIDFCDYTGRWN